MKPASPLSALILRPCRKAKAIEFMVVDALLEADSALRISHKIHDPADFQQLDDGLLDVSVGCGCGCGCGGGVKV